MNGPSVTLPPLTTAPADLRPSPGTTSFSNFAFQALQAAYWACISSGEAVLGVSPAGKRKRYRNLVLAVAVVDMIGSNPSGLSAVFFGAWSSSIRRGAALTREMLEHTTIGQASIGIWDRGSNSLNR